jgi:hypothetical protein
MKQIRKGSKTWRCPNNGDPKYDEDKHFRSWWDLTKQEQLHFAHMVKDKRIEGWDDLKEASYEFGFTPDEDMPSVSDLLADAEVKVEPNPALVKIQELANKGYAGGDGMGDYFNPTSGQPTDWHSGDSLEWFIAIEIAETFDEKASRSEQIHTAVEALQRGVNELQGAITALQTDTE